MARISQADYDALAKRGHLPPAPKPKRAPRSHVDLGDTFIALWARYADPALPLPIREHRFMPPRRFRFDAAFPRQKVAVELEGAVWVQGRHTRGAGYQSDLAKYNFATLRGWKLLRYTATDLRSRPLQVIEEVSSLLTVSTPGDT